MNRAVNDGRDMNVWEQSHNGKGRELPRAVPGDDGSNSSASRFFMTADWSLDIAERLAQADPVYYCAKAAHAERDQGLLGHIACVATADAAVVHEGDPRQTTCHYRLDATGQPVRDKDGKIIWSHCRRNGHPTVKPALTLCKWLATLLFATCRICTQAHPRTILRNVE